MVTFSRAVKTKSRSLMLLHRYCAKPAKTGEYNFKDIWDVENNNIVSFFTDMTYHYKISEIFIVEIKIEIIFLIRIW